MAKFLTKQDLAERWKVSKASLDNWARYGKLPKPQRIGKRNLWREDEIERFETPFDTGDLEMVDQLALLNWLVETETVPHSTIEALRDNLIQRVRSRFAGTDLEEGAVELIREAATKESA